MHFNKINIISPFLTPCVFVYHFMQILRTFCIINITLLVLFFLMIFSVSKVLKLKFVMIFQNEKNFQNEKKIEHCFLLDVLKFKIPFRRRFKIKKPVFKMFKTRFEKMGVALPFKCIDILNIRQLK